MSSFQVAHEPDAGRTNASMRQCLESRVAGVALRSAQGCQAGVARTEYKLRLAVSLRCHDTRNARTHKVDRPKSLASIVLGIALPSFRLGATVLFTFVIPLAVLVFRHPHLPRNKVGGPVLCESMWT